MIWSSTDKLVLLDDQPVSKPIHLEHISTVLLFSLSSEHTSINWSKSTSKVKVSSRSCEGHTDTFHCRCYSPSWWVYTTCTGITGSRSSSYPRAASTTRPRPSSAGRRAGSAARAAASAAPPTSQGSTPATSSTPSSPSKGQYAPTVMLSKQGCFF